MAAAYGVELDVVDVDERPSLAEAYEVKSVPTFVVTDDDGSELFRGVGAAAVQNLVLVLSDA